MLTNLKCNNAKPRLKPYKLTDEKSLYLEVLPSGAKYWRYRYRFGGKQKRIAFGVYPDVSLKLAREHREEARQYLAKGVDPSAIRKARKLPYMQHCETFEAIAREWFEKHSASWVPAHAARVLRRLEKEVFPWLGDASIRSIDAPTLLKVMQRIEDRGTNETARRVLQYCGRILRYAIATGRADQDCSAALKGVLPPVKGKHFAAITDPKQVAGRLRAIDSYQGTFVVHSTLKAGALVFCPPRRITESRMGAL